MKYTRVIYIIRLSAIGDIVIASQAIHSLYLNGYYPIFITSKKYKQIIEAMPYIQAFICIEKNEKTQFYIKNNKVDKEIFLDFIKKINVEKKSLFLDLQKTSRSKKAYKEIKNLIQFEKIYFVSKRTLYRIFLIIIGFLFFSQKKLLKKVSKKIITIHNLHQNIIQKILIKDQKKSLNTSSSSLILDYNNFLELNKFNITKKLNYICLFPGASGFIKMWPKENFFDLIQLILKNTQFHIILCGSHDEKNIGEFLDFPKNNRVLNLIDKTNIIETIQLVCHSKYIVTNDSFPSHVAHAFHIPATVLFGSTSPSFGFAPNSENIKIEYANLACSPCSRHGLNSCRYENLKCFIEISADQVFGNFKKQVYLNNA